MEWEKNSVQFSVTVQNEFQCIVYCQKLNMIKEIKKLIQGYKMSMQ